MILSFEIYKTRHYYSTYVKAQIFMYRHFNYIKNYIFTSAKDY